MPEARPQVACDMGCDRGVAGRVSVSGRILEVYAAGELAPGSVVPDLTEANIRQPEALREALREVLDEVAGRSKDVIAVLPDAAARVMLLDFDTLPPNAREADGVVRFRLKKSLPFDVEQAKVSYVSQPAKESGVRVVAAVVLDKVLEEY